MGKGLKKVGDSTVVGENPSALLPLEPTACANCGTLLHGPVCHECGQKAHSPMRHIGALIEDVFDSFFDFDNRLLRTLPALYFRPGFLTREYFAGRRIRYLPPFRTMFLLSVLAFFAIQFGIDASKVRVSTDGAGAFADAKTPAEVRQMLDVQLQGLQQADKAGGAIAAAGVDMARKELERQAGQRIRTLASGVGPAPAAPPDGALSQWPEWVAAADTMSEVQERTSRAIAAIDRKRQTASATDSAGADLDALDKRVYQAAGRRMATLGSADEDGKAAEETVGIGLFDRLGHDYANRARQNLMQMRTDPQARQRLVATMFNILPPVLVAMLPLFAVLLKLMYVFKRRLYVEHLIVALHSHGFIFLSLLLLALVSLARTALAPLASWTQSPMGWLIAGLTIWIPLYLLIMQKRIYQQGWIMTVAKFSVLGVAYSILLSLTLVAVVLAALGSM